LGTRSSSRLKGDDYQHLVTWSTALGLLEPGNELDHLRVEQVDDCAADDVVYVPDAGRRQPTSFRQVKGHVDYRRGYSLASLVDPGEQKQSLLQKLAHTFESVSPSCPFGAEIALVSNWPWANDDPLGSLIDAFDGGRLKAEVFAKSPGSRVAKVKRELTSRLQIDDARLDVFLRSLRFNLGHSPNSAIQVVEAQMAAAKMMGGEAGRSLGIAIVRDWIKKKLPKVDRQAVLDGATQFGLFDKSPEDRSALEIHLQTYKDDALGNRADLRFDWYPLFGNSSYSDEGVWERELVPEMTDAQLLVSAVSPRRTIRILGRFHLSAGALAGYAFRHTTGFTLHVQQREETWTTRELVEQRAALSEELVAQCEKPTHLVIGCGIMQNPTPAVTAYCNAHGIGPRHHVNFRPLAGYSHKAVVGADNAMEVAYQVVGRLRDLRQSLQAEKVHLFLAVPQALAVFIGYRMNKCGPVQMYEFDSQRYRPSCILPG